MDKPEGFIETFSRPHLVRENEAANQTVRAIQDAIQATQRNVTTLQQQLGIMRRDGKSTLEDQTKMIRRITAANGQVDDMGRQIGTLQDLVRFNLRCIAYIDWLKGVTP